MDIHFNNLVFEEGFRSVDLDAVSFRDIDQEFVIIETSDSYDSLSRNDLYYCYIRPYEGLFFRLIGQTDEETQDITIDEDIPEKQAVDLSYSDLKTKRISKIIENGDLLSNQQIVNIGFELYEDEDLVKTRSVTWIDSKRKQGNPDVVSVDCEGETAELCLKAVTEEGLLASDGQGMYLIREDFHTEKAEPESAGGTDASAA